MKTQIVHLHRKAPAKPEAGLTCNGCGVCCALDTCPVARLRFLRIRGPCPALEWSEPELHYRCGLLTQPIRFFPALPHSAENFVRRLMVRWIAAGKGCDCNVEISDPKD